MTPPAPDHRVLLAVIAAAAAATLVGLFVLWPTGTGSGLSEFLGRPPALLDARVEAVEVKPCAGTVASDDVRCVELALELSDGPDRGTTVLIENSQGGGAPTIEVGDKIVVGHTPEAPPGAQYYIADFQRRGPMLLLTALFVVAVVALARTRGLRALAGLGISLGVLLTFVLPAILDGRSPVAVAVVGSAVIVLVNLYLAHGVNLQTSTAVVGTLASLGLIAVLAAVFVAAAHFSGLASEEASFLQAAAGRINLQGLVLGGIVIGSLGVLDDVTVTQASAVWELHQANPALGAAGLYRSALRIGRDHIASTVNTLVLAYAGASLPLLILLVEANQGAGDVLTGEVVAVEVVRTLVGSIGLVAAVPITTALAAVVVAGRRPPPPAVA
ncbi:MAG: YibE/F family protein [Acidimicrobiales bacterium]